jgi:hypothetical protein
MPDSIDGDPVFNSTSTMDQPIEGGFSTHDPLTAVKRIRREPTSGTDIARIVRANLTSIPDTASAT